jgi:hypothetical protein
METSLRKSSEVSKMMISVVGMVDMVGGRSFGPLKLAISPKYISWTDEFPNLSTCTCVGSRLLSLIYTTDFENMYMW